MGSDQPGGAGLSALSQVAPSQLVVRDGRIYHLGLRPEEVAPRFLLVGDPARAHKVAAHFDSIEHRVEHREYVTLTGRHHGLPVSVVGTGIGTDNVEIALIELHALAAIDLATKRPHTSRPRLDFIRVGTSGGVAGDLAGGTLCIAEYGLGFDSTGPYYEVEPADEVVLGIERQARHLLDGVVPADARFRDRLPIYASRADEEVHAALDRSARRAGATFASGITASSPGFFGPSSRHVEGLVNTVPDIKATLGALGVAGRRVLNMEMESSLLFHLAGALGHRAGTICPVISAPTAAAAVVDYDERIEAAIAIALDALAELSGSD